MPEWIPGGVDAGIDRAVDAAVEGTVAGEDVTGGPPPLIGTGRVAGSVPLGARLAGAAGYELGQTDQGRDVTRDFLSETAGVGTSPEGTDVPWRVLGIVGVVLVAFIAIGQLIDLQFVIGDEA
jgi:hypothetical protein